MKISDFRARAAVLLMSMTLVVLAALPAAAQDANGFVYVLRNDTAGNGGSKIYGYRVEPATGLTALSGFPVATGGQGSAPGGMSKGIVIDRANRRLFAINLTSRTVSGFAIAPTTGALTALPFSPISLGTALSTETVQCLAVHPSGSPLVVASRFIEADLTTRNGRAYSFNVTATGATAASGSPYLTGTDTNPLSCEFSRDGTSFYTGGYFGSHFAGLAVDAASGVLTPLAGSPFLGGNAIGAFATDASGRLFAADVSANVRAYTTSAGIPTQASSAASGLSTTWDGLLHPAGFYIVAASVGAANVGVFQISGSGGGTTLAAVTGSPFASGGTLPFSLALDRTGTLLFLTNSLTRNVTTFSVNTSTGALTVLNTQLANTLGATGDIGGITFVPMADDLAIDFGAAGLWARYNDAAWAPLHTASPTAMATGDLDADGHADLIATFPGFGVWAWVNNINWLQLHTADASAIATGDMDGDGLDEVILVFPGFGVWVWANNRANNPVFVQLHTQDPNRVITGDLDGNGLADVVFNFPGQGIWVRQNNSTWQQLHTTDGTAFTIGDFDGSGRADLLVNFPSFGLWQWKNNTAWAQVHPFNATVMTAGDIDGSGSDDAIISFPGVGVWVWKNGTTFQQLHTADADLMTAADIDGSGRSDVVIGFPGFGIWVWKNNTTWTQLHTQNPQGMTTGNLDGN